jgi:putative DNA primase/helicase
LDTSLLAQQPRFFVDATKGAAFANGFVTIQATLKLHAHSPDHRARTVYPFDFIPNARPTKFLAFLDGIFRDDADKAQKVALVQEFFGAARADIAPGFQQCVVGLGSGENGKTALCEIVSAAMPPGTVSSIPPQVFAKEYQRAQLAGKLLNSVSELPEADIVSSQDFKAIVSGDLINARQIYKEPFDFHPQAAHFFACNSLPHTNDITHGFWRRFILLTFNRNFKNDPERVKDIHKLIIAAELPLIVCWLLEGAARAITKGHYAIPASHEEALAEWRRTGNQIALFVEEELVPAEGTMPGKGSDWGKASALYSLYSEWVELNGHGRLSSVKFAARLADLGYPKKKTKAGWYYALKQPKVTDGDGAVTGFSPNSSPAKSN